MTEYVAPVVKVTDTGVTVLKGTISDEQRQIVPEELGTYQWRPIGKLWESGGPESSGGYYPVYGWAEGELPPEEWLYMDGLIT